MTATGGPRPLPDREARLVATTEFERNLVVRAGAGTGKTSLLVERALNFIGLDLGPLSRIVAITFTEKAAGEMRGRLAQGLDRLRELATGDDELDPARGQEADRAFDFLTGPGGVDREAIAGRALAAMEELDQARISTIHGLCSDILREFPVQAEMDPDFVVDSGEHAERFRRELWESFLARELGPRATRAALWRELLSRMPLVVVGEVAVRLAEFGVPDRLLTSPVRLPVARELFGEEARTLAGRIDSMLVRQKRMTRTALPFFEGARDALVCLADEGIEALRRTVEADGALARRLEAKSGKLTANKALEGVTAAEFDELFVEARTLIGALTVTDDELLTLAVEAVAPFALEFREAFVRGGRLGFDGLLAKTRDLLRDDTDVRRELKRRWRMLLVDEFQDTDPVQYEIVLWLAERPDDDGGEAYDAHLDAGRLFVVGDAKQSIYRFRGADYSAYRRAVERIVEQGGRALELVGNFRAHPGLVDPVNRLFDSADSCWAPSDYQPDYVPIEAVTGDAGPHPGVELWSLDLPADVRAENRRRTEGLVVAGEIQRLVEEDRSCFYRDVTILFRTFNHLSFYLRPLRERGIPFVVDGGREFLERPEVGQLIATLRALALPADPVALLAFLRSPAAGVADTELAAFAGAQGRWSWREEADRGVAPRIADAFEMLRELDLETRHLPADLLVRRVVRRARLLPLGAAAFEGPQRVANLRKLTAAAGELARDGSLSLEDVVEALAEGRLADIETDRPLADDAAEAVRITSIHRMKGLENEVVILPDLARGEPRGSRDRHAVELLRRPDGRTCLALEAGGISSSSHVLHAIEDRRHSAAEETRVLYVAVTRPRQRLILVAGPASRGAPWVDALRAWGYDPATVPDDGARMLDGQVLHRVMRPSPVRRARVESADRASAGAVRAWAEAQRAAADGSLAPFVSPSAEVEDGAGVSEARGEAVPDDGGSADVPLRPRPLDRESPERRTRRAIGVVLHRWLEDWDGDDGHADMDRLAPLCERTAGELSVDGDALAEETGRILRAFLGSELAERLASVETLGREVPMLMATGDGRAWRGKIDLLYRDTEGRIIVADYKTDAETDDNALRGRYGGQLETYAEAVRRALDLDRLPGTELWLLRSGRRLALTE